MENSHLIELLKTLKDKELSKIKDFIENPYFTIGRYRKDARVLLIALLRYAPKFNLIQKSRAKIYNLIFPDSSYTEGRLEKAMVDAYKIVKLFLLAEYYFKDEQQNQMNLDFAQILREKGMVQKASALITSTEKNVSEKKLKSTEDYQLLYRASALEHVLETQKSKLSNDVSKTLNYLDLSYLSNRFVILNYHLHKSKIEKNESINLENEHERLKHFHIKFEEIPDLELAQKIFYLYSKETPAIEDFEHLLSMLLQHEANISTENLKYYFGLIRSYCSLLILNGYTELIPTLHRINVDNLSKGYFYHMNCLTAGAYMNISSMAIKVKQYTWVYDFIEEHKNRVLGDNESKDFYRLTLANYLFHIGKFEEALDNIPSSTPHFGYHLLGRKLELMIYYETRSPLLEPKLDAFRMYVSRASKKIMPEDTRERNAYFINFMYQIIQSRPGHKRRGEIIIARIKDKKIVAMADWLMEKARALK